ncbi:MAG TPA: hypothetical protein VGS19_25990 [Streptosporangiaceae bacterium]|nr:hypothetical protein [Streptosporangiaceae bacterium]
MGTLTFLPWARAGAGAAVNAAAATMGPSRLAFTADLTVTKTPDTGTPSTLPVGVSMQMLGPGDVLGFAPGQVIRTEPADGATGVEPALFPAVEFSELTLPWLFTPAPENAGWPGAPAPPPGSHRLLPWVCLVVVPDKDGITLDTSKRTLTIAAPADARQELPDLSEAWAWAHVQYAGNLEADAAGSSGQPASAALVAGTLAGSAGAGLSRLLSPRQLVPDMRYFGCVVPTFMAGRVAGLGGSPGPAAGPAWDVSPAGEASLTLPVYFSFTFTTGVGGDFLSLAQQLAHPPQVPAAPGTGLGSRTLTVSVPATATTPATTVPLTMAGMLEPINAVQPADPSTFATVQQWLQAELTPTAGTLPQLRPTLYGAPQAGISPASLMTGFGQLPAWFTTLNCDPRLRVAAALGRRVVAAEREPLLAAAWAQVQQALEANALLAKAQLARSVTSRQAAKHLPADDSLTFLQTTSPHSSRVQATAPTPGGAVVGSIWSVVRDQQADPRLAAVASAAYRRLARPRGPHARHTAAPAPPQVLIPAAQLTPASPAFDPGQTVAHRVFAERVLLPPPAATAAQATGQDEMRGFAAQVSYPFGMVTPLEQVSLETVLPGADTIPPNTALVLKNNPALIAAYMVGLNTEISQLLTWRSVPADPRATPFTYFWDQRGQAAGGPDIQPIAGWPGNAALSAQVAASAGSVFLAVRADLLRRYPSTAVFATPAQPVSGSAGHTITLSAANIIQPAFTASLPPDLHLYAFPTITPAEATGVPGYFFVFQQQASETRFGTDLLTKASLAAPPGNYWTVSSLVPKGAAPPAEAAAVAAAVLMLPGLVAIHARLLQLAGG